MDLNSLPQIKATATSKPEVQTGTPAKKVTVAGLECEERTSNGKKYITAKVFDHAYGNVDMKFGDTSMRLGSINLQDFSQVRSEDRSTQQARATLLTAIKNHGLEAVQEKVQITITLNVSGNDAEKEDKIKDLVSQLMG